MDLEDTGSEFLLKLMYSSLHQETPRSEEVQLGATLLVEKISLTLSAAIQDPLQERQDSDSLLLTTLEVVQLVLIHLEV